MSRVFSFLLLAIAFTVPTASGAFGQELPPGVVNTQDPKDVSLTPRESLARITVPDGFQVTLFAGEPAVRRPIAFDFDDRGRLWVVENFAHPVWKEDNKTDRVLILEDTNHDGEFDKRTVFWDEGRYLTSIAVGHGGVWLANVPELIFLPDANHDDRPDGPPEVKLDGFQKSKNNVLNNFHWGPDGWLYGANGLAAKSRIGKPGTPDEQRVEMTRGIWRYHPITKTFETVAAGMVNPWGADFNEYGDLFTSNTVLAHLWHIVPGMYCERRASERDNPFAYARIQSIANHLHWGGGQWQASRQTTNQHSVAGGGHAHCGGMIYLGDNWPKKYVGTFFTNNLHGNRVNNELLVPHGSSWIGEHTDDFLFGNDPWFRGLSIKYGPDGGVYVSDWHDTGECHDSDGSHRSSGRIYKVVYKTPPRRTPNLLPKTSVELAKLQTHPNAWYARHARRILHERAASGTDLSSAVDELQRIFQSAKTSPQRLRALWTLQLCSALDEAALVDLLNHADLHVRRWAVRFLVDHSVPRPAARKSLATLAGSEREPKVRLALACALQRLPHSDRIAISKQLTQHRADALDHYIPLMIWYGLEPCVPTHRTDVFEIAANSKIPIVREFIARRLADEESPRLNDVFTWTQSLPVKKQTDVLRGVLAGLKNRGRQRTPNTWSELQKAAQKSDSAELRAHALQLSILFGDRKALAELRQRISNSSIAAKQRSQALTSLLAVESRGTASSSTMELLHSLVQAESPLRTDAIKALVANHTDASAGILLKSWSAFDREQRQAAVSVLVTRANFAKQLLAAIESGDVSRRDVSAYSLQQLQAFSNESLRTRVAKIWADDTKRLTKSAQITEFKQLLTRDYLANGDAHHGRAVFERNCAKCHTLFGEGGTIAPDLTGSGRKETDYVIRNLVDPSAEIDAAYRLTNVLTDDGRLFSGFIVKQDDSAIVLRTQDTQIRLKMKNVDELINSNVSMMPEGLLRSMKHDDLRDLLVYLASDDQVELQE